MTEKKSADSKKAEVAPANKATAADVAASKKAADKATSAKASAATSAGNAEKAATDKDVKARNETAGTAAKTGGSKPAAKARAKPLSAEQKSAADDAIKSRKGVDDLKARAAAAKKRAQEKILEKSFVSDPPSDPLERLANTFDNSARRWEMVVYPSLFAFVLLAGYGFFLIYRLTHDIATLSQSVTHMAVIVSDAMPRMTKDLNMMTNSVDNMTGNIDNMSGDIGGMSLEISSMSGQMNSLTPMSQNIQSMTSNLGSMNRSVYGMQRDMHGMNRTVSSGPFGMMNDIMPFSSDTNVPPQMAPPQVWPSYNPIPQQNQMYGRPPAPQPRIQPNAAPTKSSKPAISPEKTTGPVSTKQATDGEKDNVKTEVTMPGASPVILKK